MIRKSINQKGMALVYTLILTTAVITLATVASKLTINSMLDSRLELDYKSQVLNVAQAGVQDAYFWFSRQNSVVKKNAPLIPFADNAFQPIGPSIIGGKINKGDTDDPSIGIVRDFLINESNNIYGHYEVKKQLTDNETNPSSYDREAVHDISHLRYSVDVGQGSVWRVVSKGYVYHRGDKGTDSFTNYTDKCCENMLSNTKNRVISSRVITAEVQRLSLEVPNAAISIFNGDVSASSLGYIIGSSSVPGIRYGSPSVPSGISGLSSPRLIGGAISDPSIASKILLQSVFGVDRDTMKGISDNSVDDISKLDTSKKFLSSLVFIDADNATFDKNDSNKKVLKGSGILFVKGNLTFAPYSGSYFSGVIYVENGNVNIGAGNNISGALIVAGNGKNVSLNASGDSATVEYNQGIIDNVRKKLANYRLNKLSFKSVQ